MWAMPWNCSFARILSAIAVSSRAGAIPKPPQTPPRLFLSHPHRLLRAIPPAKAPAPATGAVPSSVPPPPPPASVAPPSSRYHEGGSGFGPQHHHWVARGAPALSRHPLRCRYDTSDMLPGLSPPPPLVLMGCSPAPSVSPSASPSSSIGASIAIIAAIIIAASILTCCIVILRLSSRRRRMSGSSFSGRRNISPKASSSAESEMNCAAATAVGASVRVNASFLKNAEVCGSGLEDPVPSAPCLPEVVLELLSQSPVLVQPGSSVFCCFCGQVFVPTDMIVALPVCSHKFHQLCIVAWILRPADSCPFCDTPITTPCANKTSLAPVYSSDQYDIEAMMIAPAPPGEEVTEAVGRSRGWLRSSLDRLSGSWRGCSNNQATAVVVLVSSQHTTRSWRPDNMGHLGIDSNGIQMQSGEEVEAVGGSRGWLWSYLATLSSTWSGRSESRSTTVVLPVSSGRATGSLSLVPSGCGSTDSWSRSWDLQVAEQRT